MSRDIPKHSKTCILYIAFFQRNQENQMDVRKKKKTVKCDIFAIAQRFPLTLASVTVFLSLWNYHAFETDSRSPSHMKRKLLWHDILCSLYLCLNDFPVGRINMCMCVQIRKPTTPTPGAIDEGEQEKEISVFMTCLENYTKSYGKRILDFLNTV